MDLAATNTELVERIAQRLYVVNAQIFEGLQEEDFVRYVFRSRFGCFVVNSATSSATVRFTFTSEKYTETPFRFSGLSQVII